VKGQKYTLNNEAACSSSAMMRVSFISVVASLSFSQTGAIELRESKSQYTVNDKVIVNGVELFAGAQLDTAIGCHTAEKTSSFKVCGCGVKVVAALLTECQEYSKYSSEIGTCDCGQSGCVEKTLTSGYTDKFEWKATSYEIKSCK